MMLVDLTRFSCQTKNLIAALDLKGQHGIAGQRVNDIMEIVCGNRASTGCPSAFATIRSNRSPALTPMRAAA